MALSAFLNDPPYEMGYFQARIGRRDESKPDPHMRYCAVSARGRMNSGGWNRVRDLFDHDRDREAESSWASYHLGYCCPADFSHDNQGRIVLSFLIIKTWLDSTSMMFDYMPEIYFRMT